MKNNLRVTNMQITEEFTEIYYRKGQDSYSAVALYSLTFMDFHCPSL